MTTVEEPALEDDAKTANSSVVVNHVEVFGLGLFLNDVASIDLSAGTFYGDVDVFVLKYYRPFLDAGTALKEATVETARGRGTFVAEGPQRFAAADIRKVVREHVERLLEDLAGADVAPERLAEIVLKELEQVRARRQR